MPLLHACYMKTIHFHFSSRSFSCLKYIFNRRNICVLFFLHFSLQIFAFFIRLSLV